MKDLKKWPEYTEEERYGIWSTYIERGGRDMTFFQFCDFVDGLYA